VFIQYRYVVDWRGITTGDNLQIVFVCGSFLAAIQLPADSVRRSCSSQCCCCRMLLFFTRVAQRCAAC